MVVKLRQASAAPAEGNAVAAPPAEISPDARPAAAAIAAAAAPAAADDEVPPGDDGSTPSVDKIPTYVINMQKSHDFAQQFAAVRAVRKLLSKENNPPIQDVIDSGAVPHLVQLIKPGVARATLQFEATWALTNIVSGNSSHTQIVIDAGALPFFAQLLHLPNQQVREQAVWALGNTAGDSPAHRDKVIATGCAPRLAEMATVEDALPVLRNVTWTMSNMCRGKPPVSFASISCFVKPLAKLLCSADTEIIADAAWALSYITENADEADPIQIVITTAGVVGRLVELLSHRATNVQTVALRTVGNIVTGNDHQTQCMLDAGCLVPIGALMSNAKKSLRKEAAWTISCVCHSSHVHVSCRVSSSCRTRSVALSFPCWLL
jgi:importin subunit alpha-1